MRADTSAVAIMSRISAAQGETRPIFSPDGLTPANSFARWSRSPEMAKAGAACERLTQCHQDPSLSFVATEGYFTFPPPDGPRSKT